jgi:hypothetical protein
MKKSRKDFIKKAHSAACNEWKTNIEAEFPKLFKKDALVVGKWYKIDNKDGYLLNYSETGIVFGFLNGNYSSNYYFYKYHYDNAKPATDEEVEEALIKEAKKRGFKKGVKFKCLYNHDYEGQCTPLLCSEGYLWLKGGCVFKDGKWATTVRETITKEQAEKELGKTILN